MKKIICGLTGGIASGKSTIAKLLTEKSDIDYFNTDQMAKNFITNHLDEVSILLGDTIPNLKTLASIIFCDVHKRRLLENLIHPKVKVEVERLVSQSSRSICLVESALIIESSWVQYFDVVISAICPDNVKIDRAVKRGLSAGQVTSRINCQVTDNFRFVMSNILLYTDCSIPELVARVEKLHTILRDIQTPVRTKITID